MTQKKEANETNTSLVLHSKKLGKAILGEALAKERERFKERILDQVALIISNMRFSEQAIQTHTERIAVYKRQLTAIENGAFSIKEENASVIRIVYHDTELNQ